MIGYIYKISCDGNEACYVGSTDNFIKRRIQHKSYLNNTNSPKYNFKLYKHIRANGGWDAWDMTVIEEYPYNDKIELLKRERYWIETLGSSLNHNVPTRTDKQYRQDNKEKIANKNKKYRQENKEAMAKRDKQYYEDNKEKILKRNKQYHQDNKEARLKQRKQHYKDNKEEIIKRNKQYYQDNRGKILQKIKCTCGSVVVKVSLRRHERSIKHKTYVENNKSL